MRAPAFALVLLVLVPPVVAEDDGIETRRYQSLWPAEELAYLLAEVEDGTLVCEPAPTPDLATGLQRRSLGGVCFDVPAGSGRAILTASTTLLVFTPPTFVLWWQDAEGGIVESEWRCEGRVFELRVPAESVRLMMLAIDGAPGCPTGPAVWGTVTARFGG